MDVPNEFDVINNIENFMLTRNSSEKLTRCFAKVKDKGKREYL